MGERPLSGPALTERRTSKEKSR